MKKMLVKFGLWCLGLVVFAALMEWFYTAWLPPVTTEMAVAQLANSDAAYTALRTHETLKNLVSAIAAMVAVGLSIIVWWAELRYLGERLAKATLRKGAGR